MPLLWDPTCTTGGERARMWMLLRLRAWKSSAAILAVFSVSGCLSLERTPEEQPVATAHFAALAGGRVVVVPPQGYCIELDSLQARDSGGFALLASCESLSGFVSGYNVEPAVITVTAVERKSDGREPDAVEIAAALGVPKVRRQLHGDGLTVVQVSDDTPVSEGGDPKHWRGIMVLNGQMVGLALYGARGSELSGTKGLNLLIWLAEQIREASPIMGRTAARTPQGIPVAQLAVTPIKTVAVTSLNTPVLRPRARPGTPQTPVVVEKSKQKPKAGLKNLWKWMLKS